MLAREGFALIVASAALAAVLVALAVWTGRWWGGAIGLIGVSAFAFTVWFFRDPPRTAPPGAEELLLAPADGKVIEIVEEVDSLYVQGPVRRVSIFLSPLNVHVNRAPAAGVVEHAHYVPGDYLVAWHPKASEKNERSEIGVRHASGVPVLFKQIAGAVARRIVFHVEKGDTLEAGERFGIVKFGSRMDVLVPPEVEIITRIGTKTVAGETVIGRLPGSEGAKSADLFSKTR